MSPKTLKAPSRPTPVLRIHTASSLTDSGLLNRVKNNSVYAQKEENKAKQAHKENDIHTCKDFRSPWLGTKYKLILVVTTVGEDRDANAI